MSGESVPQAPNVYWGQVKRIQVNSDAEALQNNLKWAELAVKYARSVIPYVGNDVRDVLKSYGGSFVGQLATRPAYFLDQLLDKKTGVAQARDLAKRAERSGLGNCGEISAVAFTYLLDNGVRPIDWMEIKNGDHNFVLIGRRSGDARNSLSWGPRCVICDPWRRVSKAAGPGADYDYSCGRGSVMTQKWFQSDARVE